MPVSAPDEEPQWEVTGDVPDHIREFISSEVNSQHFPTPREMQESVAMWGQYPPPATWSAPGADPLEDLARWAEMVSTQDHIYPDMAPRQDGHP